MHGMQRKGLTHRRLVNRPSLGTFQTIFCCEVFWSALRQRTLWLGEKMSKVTSHPIAFVLASIYHALVNSTMHIPSRSGCPKWKLLRENYRYNCMITAGSAAETTPMFDFSLDSVLSKASTRGLQICQHVDKDKTEINEVVVT